MPGICDKTIQAAAGHKTSIFHDVQNCNLWAAEGDGDGTGRTAFVEIATGPYPRLQEMAKGDGKQLADVLRAAWALVLRFYTGMEEICFGYQQACPGTDGLVERRFVQVDLEDTTRIEGISRLMQLHSPDNAAGGGMFKYPYNTTVELGGGALKSREDAILDEHNHVCLRVKMADDGLRMFLDYKAAVISAEEALGVVSTLTHVFEQIVASPNCTVGELDPMSLWSWQKLRDWNATSLEREERCIHDVIGDQAKSRPDAEAVCAWDGSLTYSKLNTLATRLAHRLVALGITTEKYVPLCFKKSKWAVVSMLAVLKAGGAFVPLDPAHPISRLQSLSRRVGAGILLCSRQYTDKLAAVAERIIPIDDDAMNEPRRLPGFDTQTELPDVSPSNAAYIIFTSGTTGEPKGAILEHGAFCSSARAHAPAIHINSDSRVLQFAAYTFDSSLIETLTPLMVGACVCIPSEEARLNHIASTMASMRVDLAILTPSFVSFLQPSQLPQLRTLVLAGEAMSKEHVATWSHINLVNGYGPTECAVSAIINPSMKGRHPANVGRPVGGHCWLVEPESHHRLVPVGCTGELLVEGPTLARGYLDDEKKTSEAFIRDPAWAPGRRFYKTGDLLRYNPDGTLQFIGRKDTQVKIHGQRVELGEIEHPLAADANVKHGLVLLPKVGPCAQKIVAVLSLAGRPDGEPLQVITDSSMDTTAKYISTLRTRLSARLPTYMVPAIWIIVAAIPLLTSGKLDRKRVGKWLEEFSDDMYRRVTEVAQDEHDALSRPATDVESKIRRVLSHVLNLDMEQVGLNRSFLNLGGDSISAMQVMGRCQRLNVGVKVQQILRSKSIAELASCATDAKQSSDYEEVVEQEFGLSPIQRYFFMLPNQGSGYFNQSVFLRVTRMITRDDLQHAIETIIKRHSMLRARFSRTGLGGTWRQRVTDNVSESFRLRQLHAASRSETTSHIAASHASLNAVRGPLLAVDLFETDQREQLLFLTASHLVIDLVSWRVVMEELEDILSNPRAPMLAPTTMPFQAWCRLQVEHAQAQLPATVLPVPDVPRGDLGYWGMENIPNNYGEVVSEGFELDANITALIMNSCHNALRTEPVDILVAALLSSFAQVFPDRTVPPLYTETHGREPWNDSIDISRTVGWFTSLYPVVVPMEAFNDIVDIVRHVKDIRRRIPDNGRPYFATRFLTAHGEEAFQTHWPMEIAFNYLGQYQQLERDGALLQPVEELAGEARGAGGTADVGELAPRFALFEISAVITQGKLRFSFTYNRRIRHQGGLRRWVGACSKSLSLIAESLYAMAPAPTLSDFPLLSLSYDDLAMLAAQRLPEKGVRNISEVEDIYPASPMQQGLLLSRMKNSNFYSVHGISEVKNNSGAPVDATRLADAWNMVVEHHAALRTIFAEKLDSSNSLYSQIVLKHLRPEVVRLSCEDDSAAVDTLVSQEAAPYNEQSRPPHRFTVCQTKLGKVFCKLEISHTIIDGSSMSLLMRDLALAYDGRLDTRVKPLLSDYIAHITRTPSDNSLQYWRSYLDGVEPCHIPLLTDGVVAMSKQLRSIRVDVSKFTELQAFGAAQGVTLSNIFHVAWAMTLHYFVGTSRPCFGYLASGRDASILHSENAIGPFINMLACQIELSPNTRICDVLDKVQQDYVDSLPHCMLSLADVQHALGLSDTTLFNTIISYRKLPPVCESRSTTISFTERVPNHDPTEYNMSINVETTDETATVDLYYWSDAVSDDQAGNIANTFKRALENIHCHKDSLLGELDPLGISDYDQIFSWNKCMPSRIDSCIHWTFEQQVNLRPQSPALCGWDGNFTFEQLNSAANRVAHHLVTLGVTPDTYVALCFDKSVWTIVAMLGIMKAGGACVPLDPSHPRSALEVRIREVGASVALVAPQYARVLDNVVRNIVTLSSSIVDGLPLPNSLASRTVQPSNAAFVIFTSGSTGIPKAVVLEHRSLVTSFNAHGSALEIGPRTRMLQFSAYTFDNSLEEMFTTLTRGGCVCVPSLHDRMNDLAGAISRMNVNFCCLTPTVASFLDPRDVPTVKDLALGGEPLTKKDIEVWSESVRLHGQYGPSECSIDSAVHVGISPTSEPTNLGRSVGCVTWIVDPENSDLLVPVGCVGELVIEGPIVSRGYLNNSQKDAASFIVNPAWSHGQKLSWTRATSQTRRMYKTGDLVRYNSDGTMNYLGRIDTQIKLHGQRIELGEIESHVQASLPEDARSAIELVSIGGNESVAAFICVDPTEQDNMLLPMTDAIVALAKKIEAAVSSALASYMVPSLYIPLSSFPMTSSGKTDRRALRTSVCNMTSKDANTYRLSKKSGRAPRTHMEKTMAGLWEDVLSLEPNTVGAEDNFFRMGGDSVGAMRLVSSARANGITLAVVNIFQSPKLEDLARDLSPESESHDLAADDQPPHVAAKSDTRLEAQAELISQISLLCCVGPTAIEDVYPCTAIQEGLMALSMKDPGAYVAHNTYELTSGVDLTRFQNAWQTVANLEPILRTRIVYVQDRGFFQVVIRESLPWNNAFKLESQSPSQVPAYNGGPLTQYTLVTGPSGVPQFFWTIHHALYDGWSFPLIMKRVESCYNNMLSSLCSPITPYKSFVDYLSTIDTVESDKFWRATLSDTTAPQFPALSHPSYQARATSLQTRTVVMSRQAYAEFTIPSKVRSAWALTTAIFSDSDDVLFGESTSGRDAPVPGIEDMVGPTLATIPSKVKISRDETVEAFIRRVQVQSARSLLFQHAGLHNIKRLSPEISAVCEFQTLLAINHGADGGLDRALWKHTHNSTAGTNFYTHPLMVVCTINEGRVDVDAHFDQDVISEWRVTQMLQEFETLLQRFNSPSSLREKIGEMCLLSDVDSATIRKWNAQPLITVERCAHHIIEEQVQKLPRDTEAVCSWDASFTYTQLDELTTTLARFLRFLGVGPNAAVPICFEKCSWNVVAMLAVLKSGNAFVPLDPSAPVARLRSIVDDVGSPVLLCTAKYQIFCDAFANKVIPVHQATIDQMGHLREPLPESSSRSAMYIIYTSGSTGKPKGTVVEHAAFCTAAASHGPAMRIDATTRALQFSSHSFDVSILEILTTLGLGGCVCIPSEDARMNDIATVISQMQINWASLTPSFAQLIQPSAVPTLRTLALLGEAMSQTHISTWADKVALQNAYGPTECAVITSVKDMDSNTEPTNIGKPVGGRCWIADKHNHNRLVPVGSIGELLVEGPVLAKEYLRDEQRTNEVFIHNPAFASKTVRMYKTGDLVKYAPNGDLLFLGRKDTQTKIRGQRLEVGEVEFRLRTDPLIQHALATVPKEGLCSKRLVGVFSLRDLPVVPATPNGLEVVPHDQTTAYMQQIRERLCEWLPSYMIPSIFVVLRRLPLLPSGKLDRRQVVKWVNRMSEDVYQSLTQVDGAEDTATCPESGSEKALQNILGHVLNIPSDQISTKQSFLHLGGDSLSAMQVMARCRSEGLGVTVQDIIRSKSITELASKVVVAEQELYAEEELETPYDLSPVQTLYFQCVGDRWKQFNQSVLLRLQKHVKPERLLQAIEAIVHAHSSLRTRFAKDDTGVWKQTTVRDISASFYFKTHQYSGDIISDPTVKMTIESSQKGLNIRTGPLFAVDVFESTAGQLLCLVAHHLVIDVVSWQVILQDLEDILGDVKTSVQGSLPFQTWCRLQSEADANMFGDIYPLTDVPRAEFSYWGMDGQQNLAGDTIAETFEVDVDATSKLLDHCHNILQAEPVDLFLASMLLSFKNAFPDRPCPPAIFNEGHGRETWNSRQDLSRTIGWFTTMCPIFAPTNSTDCLDIVEWIRWIKDLRSRIPAKGRAYFAHRFLSDEGRTKYVDHWPMEVTFNYLGHLQRFTRPDALLQPVDGISGQSVNTLSNIGSEVPRFALFDVSASVNQGSITFSFTYNQKMQRQASIQAWVSRCHQVLQDAIDVIAQSFPKPSLSDFPLVPLHFGGVAGLEEKLSRFGVSSLALVSDIYPCAPMQQGILMSQMRNPAHYAYSALFEARSTRPGQLIDICDITGMRIKVGD